MVFVDYRKTLSATFLLLVLRSMACASNCNLLQKFKFDLDESIRIAKTFEEKLNDSGYTAIDIQNNRAHSQSLHEFCCKLLRMNIPDDLCTVIQIKHIAKGLTNNDEFLPDIITCLQSYIEECDKTEHFTNNIQLKAHTIRYKNFNDFVAIGEDVDRLRSIYDMIQQDIYTKVKLQIWESIKARMPYIAIKAFLFCFPTLQKTAYENDRLTICENKEIRLALIKVLEDNETKKEIYQITLNSFIANLGCTRSTVTNIMTTLEKGTESNFEQSKIEQLVERFYREKIIGIIRNNTTIITDKLLRRLQMLQDFDFENVYGWYIRGVIEQIRSRASSDVVTDDALVFNRLMNMMHENFNDFEESNNTLLEALGMDSIISECINTIVTDNFLKLKSAYHTNSLRIIVNETVTSENIYQLCHILANLGNISIRDENRIIYVNMKRGAKLKSIPRVVHKCFSGKNCLRFGSLLGAHINKFHLVSKTRGCDSIKKIYMDLALKIATAEFDSFQTHKQIQKKIYDIIRRNTVNISLIKNINVSCDYERTENSSQFFSSMGLRRHNSVDHKLMIYFDNDIEFRAIVISPCACKNEQAMQNLEINEMYFYDRHGEKNLKVESKYNSRFQKDCLLSLGKFMKTIQFMPRTVKLPKFAYMDSDCFSISELVFTIHSKNVQKLDTDIKVGLENISKVIDDFFESKKSSVTVKSLEISMADILKRSVYNESWCENIESLLKGSCINRQAIEDILDRYLIDYKRVNATNDYDLSNINIEDIKVTIHVVNRVNNALVYLVRRDLEQDLSVSPLSFFLDIYARNINEEKGDKNHPIRCQWPLDQIYPFPVKVVLEIMFDLGFNILDNARAQYYANKKEFITRLHSFIKPKLFEAMPNTFNPTIGPYTNTKNVTLYNSCLVEYFEDVIDSVLKQIEAAQSKVQSKSAIRVTAISLKNPNDADLQDICDLNRELEKFMK